MPGLRLRYPRFRSGLACVIFLLTAPAASIRCISCLDCGRSYDLEECDDDVTQCLTITLEESVTKSCGLNGDEPGCKHNMVFGLTSMICTCDGDSCNEIQPRSAVGHNSAQRRMDTVILLWNIACILAAFFMSR